VCTYVSVARHDVTHHAAFQPGSSAYEQTVEIRRGLDINACPSYFIFTNEIAKHISTVLQVAIVQKKTEVLKGFVKRLKMRVSNFVFLAISTTK
jgi:hypothetical protein